ncbi:MAG TPA: PQQ-dependent sugar dehydrogenase [Gemmatimonadales bacterium]|nr:PQQ-dependent sugar dehydrogenase [Gemmatimonadales bacterium]
MGSSPGATSDRTTFLEPILVAIGLTLAVTLRSRSPIWHVSKGLLVLGLLVSAAYLVGYFVHRRHAQRGLLRAVLITMLVSQPVMVAIWLLDINGSRVVLVAELVLLFLFIAIAGARWRAGVKVVIALVFAGVAAYPSVAAATARHTIAAEPDQVQYVFTNYTDLKVTTHRIIPDDSQDGGAFARLPDGRVLLVTGSGAGMFLDFSHGITTTPIDLHLPLEVARYRAVKRQQLEYYRVFDAEYFRRSLLVSYTNWDAPRNCYTLRLLQASFDGSSVGQWNTVFDSQPCVKLEWMNNESGGRIAVLDSTHVLLTIGTFTIEYRNHPGWRDSSDYGKVIEIDMTTGKHQPFTVGNRNPEGLLVVGDSVWSTENGPQGGDELNLLRRGADYGWPYVSYGTEYGSKTLKLARKPPGDHTGYTQPLYAWLPSIGISNLIRISSSLFPQWKNDLLIASLSGMGNGYAMFRVRLVNGRPVTIERIPTGVRGRDLMELPDGPVILWDGRGRILTVRPGDYVFSACSGCHSFLNDFQGIGPELLGVVGRRVASSPGYEYSPAMRHYGGVWTPARLNRFLANPEAEVPGTAMDFPGVPDSAKRAEIIRYLTDITGGRKP